MLTISRIAVLLLLVFGLLKPAIAQTDKFSKTQKTLIKEALKVALVTEKNLPGYAEITDKANIVVVDSMVSVDDFFFRPPVLTNKLLPELDNVTLKVQTEEQIKSQVQPKDQLFIRMGWIVEPKSEYALVHVFGEWDLGEESKAQGHTFKQADGYTLLFKKEGKKWKFQKVINRLPNLFKQR